MFRSSFKKQVAVMKEVNYFNYASKNLLPRAERGWGVFKADIRRRLPVLAGSEIQQQ